jgi:divalent metal cation (Fe/Co/Zn/Cd) transporter
MHSDTPITCSAPCSCSAPPKIHGRILWLQCITLVWMLIECGVSLEAAVTAHSPLLAAFGSDSIVELLSACVVLLSFLPHFPLTKEEASRYAGILLFVLAGVVGLIAVLTLLFGIQAETSKAGLAITAAALGIMPFLAWLKLRLADTTKNRALAADAAQSATCAYLAAMTLLGLAINALFHIRWIDSIAALLVIPILVLEGRKAMHGEGCACR